MPELHVLRSTFSEIFNLTPRKCDFILAVEF